MDKYARNKYSLQFDIKEMEWVYKNYIVDHTIWFCRGAWMLIIVLGGSFGLLDRPLFGENADKVIVVRLFLISTSAVILALTFNPRVKRFLDRSSCLFILSIGFFCIFLTAMSDHSTFSPYFTGLFFAFTGIFSTAGLGFKYSFFALLINLIVFEVVIGLLVPVP